MPVKIKEEGRGMLNHVIQSRGSGGKKKQETRDKKQVTRNHKQVGSSGSSSGRFIR